ncbi:hypothetical protein D3C87_792740 [compost metagenome]
MSPHVIDLHYGILRGTGWLQGEVPPQSTETTAATASGAGSSDLQVSSPAGFLVDQLISYVGSDGNYYSAPIKAILGSTLRLKVPLEIDVPAGALVGPFYVNEAHPNKSGYHTIVDASLRQLTHEEQLVVIHSPRNWVPYGASTISQDLTFSYNNPGCAENPYGGALVQMPGLSAGASSPVLALPAGVYSFSVPVNVGQRVGGYSGGLLVEAYELLSNGEQFVIYSKTIVGYDGIHLIKGMFSVRGNSSVRIVVRNANSGAAYASLGDLRYFRVLNKLPSFDHGKHVLFGDSWVTNILVADRLNVHLPNAQIIRSGFPGNNSIDLVARFWTDVAPHKPDFVWVMCGTNDTYAAFSATRFNTEMDTIKRNLMMIGAQPIFWNCSVCSAYFSGIQGEQLTNSRKYAMNVNYHNQVT